MLTWAGCCVHTISTTSTRISAHVHAYIDSLICTCSREHTQAIPSVWSSHDDSEKPCGHRHGTYNQPRHFVLAVPTYNIPAVKLNYLKWYDDIIIRKSTGPRCCNCQLYYNQNTTTVQGYAAYRSTDWRPEICLLVRSNSSAI